MFNRLMSEIILCDKCGESMDCSSSNISDKKEAKIYKCLNCGYNYELGFRFNKLIKQFVKYIRVL